MNLLIPLPIVLCEVFVTPRGGRILTISLGKTTVPAQRKAVLDADYQAFLAEIGETEPEPPSNPSKEVEQSYEAFMAEIGGRPNTLVPFSNLHLIYFN